MKWLEEQAFDAQLYLFADPGRVAADVDPAQNSLQYSSSANVARVP